MSFLTRSRIAMFVAVAALSAGFAGSAMAETQWEKNHPRRDQVNDRLANQNRRITNEVKEGELTKGQAAKLRANDHRVRQEERDMAAQNHGHITKTEQAALNQQLNRNSRKIGE